MIRIASQKSARCKKSPPAWHAAFEAMIPTIEEHARISFRHLDRDAYEEAIQECICNACQAYARLVERGKTDVAYASMLATFAVSQVRDGRKVGNSLNIHDVSSDYCRQRKNLVLERLDKPDETEEHWQEVLIADKTCTPAELAASRIDVPAWFASLSPCVRKIARYLSLGNKPSDAAERFGLSRCRISLLRKELHESWKNFCGEAQENVAAT